MRINVCVPTVRRRSRKDIEFGAQEFLARFAPDCLRTPQKTPLVKLFDRILPQYFGFRPQVDILQKGLEGLTDWHDQTVTLAEHVYEGLERDEGENRFTTGHELGHVVLHAPELAMRGEEMARLDGAQHALARQAEVPEEENPEWQADVFSAALLMPSCMLAEVNFRYFLELKLEPNQPVAAPPPLPPRKKRLRGARLPRSPRSDRPTRSDGAMKSKQPIRSLNTRGLIDSIVEIFGVSPLQAERRLAMLGVAASS